MYSIQRVNTIVIEIKCLMSANLCFYLQFREEPWSSKIGDPW